MMEVLLLLTTTMLFFELLVVWGYGPNLLSFDWMKIFICWLMDGLHYITFIL